MFSMVMPRGPFQGNVIRIQGVKEIDDIAVLLIPSEVTTIQSRNFIDNILDNIIILINDSLT